MKDVMDDHKNRITVITQVLTVIGRRLDDHDQLTGKIEANDSDIKAKLGSLENQIVANDQKLKQDLCTLESRVTSIAQAIEAGASPSQHDHLTGRWADFELNVESSLKGLETAIQQARTDYTQRDEELFGACALSVALRGATDAGSRLAQAGFFSLCQRCWSV